MTKMHLKRSTNSYAYLLSFSYIQIFILNLFVLAVIYERKQYT